MPLVVVLYDLTTFTKLGLEELAESSILLPAQKEAVVPVLRFQDLRGASYSLEAGPNGLKIGKKTTRDLLSRRRFMKMA